MDVSKNREIDDVIILGSGLSILRLTSEEKSYINKCKTVIALNKFMIFYKKSGIVPTHVFFLDVFENNLAILSHLFSVCIKDNLENLTLVIHKSLKNRLWESQISRLKILNLRLKIQTAKFLKSSFNFKGLKNLFTSIFSEWQLLIQVPRNSSIVFTSHHNWLEGGGWAEDLKTPLFHYRGSLTSVLNYVSIIAPNQNIYLVGADFNSGQYFFEDELKKLKFKVTDWTTPIIKENNKHFSVIEHEGTTIFDRFPYILEKLKKSNNSLFCNYKESLLVTKAEVKFKELPRF